MEKAGATYTIQTRSSSCIKGNHWCQALTFIPSQRIYFLSKGPTTFTKFARYVLVGVASNVSAYLAYLALTAIGVPYVLAMTLVYCMALIFSFSVNRKWTFQDTGTIDKRLIVRYLQCYGIGYIVNAVMLVVLVTHFSVSHQVAQGVLIILIACGLFQAQRKWVFVAG